MSRRRADKNARRQRRRAGAGGRHLHAVGGTAGERSVGPGLPPPSRTIPPELDGPGSLVEAVRAAASSPEPLDLISLASTIHVTGDARLQDPFSREEPSAPTEELVEALMSIPAWETQLLCRVMAHLSPDDALRRRVRRRQPRHIPGPAWVDDLEALAPVRAALLSDPLGDGENVALELAMPGGGTSVLVVLVDHNAGSWVKDAFTVPVGLEGYSGHMQSIDLGTWLSISPLHLAEAGRILDAAVQHALMMVPRPDGDTWPATLTLLEHVLSQLPAAPAEAEAPLAEEDFEAWAAEADARRDSLLANFVASDHWAWAKDGAELDVADLLLWIHDSFFGNDGIQRVSPTTVEIVMLDLWPRKAVAIGERSRELLPDVLRGWIRHIHSVTGIPDELTQDTLDAVDLHEPELRELLAGEPPPGVAETMARLLAGSGLGDGSPWLAERFSDPAILEDLDDDPLPDEPRSLPEDLPDRVRDHLEAALELAEPVAMEVGGTEARTALRRMTRKLCEADPRLFSRAKVVGRTAGALLWVMTGINELAGYRGEMSVGDLLERVGVSGTVADRGNLLLHSLGWRDRDDASYRVLHPELTVSSKRAGVIRARDWSLDDGTGDRPSATVDASVRQGRLLP
ncbi:hypothetical protein [Ornithinimicrobium panacihumi]|uniref:hypothetical protein n=1 Tax=Ornithinimicrobium panacihumi TaxID=2008449 RepID=UPI003F8C6852